MTTAVTTRGSRRSIDERIKEAKAQLEALERLKKEEELKKSIIPFTRESPGVEELLAQIDNVAKLNNAKVLDVLLLASRLKRIGLVRAEK